MKEVVCVTVGMLLGAYLLYRKPVLAPLPLPKPIQERLSLNLRN